MRIRFLQTTDSDNPDVPFRAGQIIEVETLTPKMRAWLETPSNGDRPSAEVLKEDAPEMAVSRDPERAVKRTKAHV